MNLLIHKISRALLFTCKNLLCSWGKMQGKSLWLCQIHSERESLFFSNLLVTWGAHFHAPTPQGNRFQAGLDCLPPFFLSFLFFFKVFIVFNGCGAWWRHAFALFYARQEQQSRLTERRHKSYLSLPSVHGWSPFTTTTKPHVNISEPGAFLVHLKMSHFLRIQKPPHLVNNLT